MLFLKSICKYLSITVALVILFGIVPVQAQQTDTWSPVAGGRDRFHWPPVGGGWGSPSLCRPGCTGCGSWCCCRSFVFPHALYLQPPLDPYLVDPGYGVGPFRAMPYGPGNRYWR